MRSLAGSIEENVSTKISSSEILDRISLSRRNRFRGCLANREFQAEFPDLLRGLAIVRVTVRPLKGLFEGFNELFVGLGK